MRLLLALLLAALLSGCGTVRNTMNDDGRSVMLRGNDPVAYFTAGKPVKGDAAIAAEHDGVWYHFSTVENRNLFQKSPDRYTPRYAGFCTSGAPYALKAAIHANVFAIYKDRLYLFGSERSKANWMMDADENIVLGDRYWETETKDVPYRVQNFRRLVFKVEHYKTDAELDAEHFKRFGRLPPGAPPLKR